MTQGAKARERRRPLAKAGAAGAAKAEAAVVTTGEVARVFDRAGRLIFEHDGATGRSVLHATGDLEIRADAGRIELSARDGVRIAGEDVAIEGRASVTATAPVGRVELREGELRAETVSTVVQVARHTAGLIETRATRVIARAQEVYREIESLSQTRAGRVRMLVRETFHLMGKRALIKAEDDVKIKAERVHLG